MIRRPPRSTLFPTRRSSDLEAAVPDVEEAGHVVRGVLEQPRGRRAALRLVQRLGHVLTYRLGVLRDFVALLAVQPRYLPQHRREPGPPEGVRLGGEVGAPEEHLARRIEKRRERPAALAG